MTTDVSNLGGRQAGGALAVELTGLEGLKLPRKSWFPRSTVIRVLSPLILLVAWELIVRIGKVGEIFLPPPLSVLRVFVRLTADGTLPYAIWMSFLRTGQGFLYGSLLGIIVGLFVGWSQIIEDIVDPLVAAIYPIPKSALFPLFMLWFGLGDPSKVVTILVGVLFLVLINTVTGVKTLNPILIRAARDLGASERQIFLKVVLPGALPNIFTGLRLGAGIALILVFVTELEATNSGLGYLLWESYQLMLVQQMFACIITFGILGILSTWFIQWLEKVLCPWSTTVTRQ
ncbi:MAG: ABC transporter permease [Candidatus Tectomicrobia bacterium]|nr:ABC transporter permease [Candidatus Tectomicrobia bacterium]